MTALYSHTAIRIPSSVVPTHPLDVCITVTNRGISILSDKSRWRVINATAENVSFYETQRGGWLQWKNSKSYFGIYLTKTAKGKYATYAPAPLLHALALIASLKHTNDRARAAVTALASSSLSVSGL